MSNNLIVNYETTFLLTNGRYAIMDAASWSHQEKFTVYDEDDGDPLHDEEGYLFTYLPLATLQAVLNGAAVKSELVWLNRNPYRIIDFTQKGQYVRVTVEDFPALDAPYLVDPNEN